MLRSVANAVLRLQNRHHADDTEEPLRLVELSGIPQELIVILLEEDDAFDVRCHFVKGCQLGGHIETFCTG